MADSSKPLDASAILAADDLTRERVDCPEWGGFVYVSTLTGEGRDAYELSVMVREPDGTFRQDLDNMRAKLVAACCVDDDGKRLFTAGQVAQLGKKSAAVINRLYQVAARLNGIGEQAVSDTAKNSFPARGGKP